MVPHPRSLREWSALASCKIQISIYGGKEGPIRPTETSVSSPTGAWVTQPKLVSDGAANLAVCVEGESCTILRVTIPASASL